MEKNEMALKIAENLVDIYSCIREGLVDNMRNIDLTKVVEFDFANNLMSLKFPAIVKDINLMEILDLIDKNNKK